MLSVHRSTWLRVYSPHWELIKTACRELDYQALMEVVDFNEIVT